MNRSANAIRMISMPKDAILLERIACGLLRHQLTVSKGYYEETNPITLEKDLSSTWRIRGRCEGKAWEVYIDRVVSAAQYCCFEQYAGCPSSFKYETMENIYNDHIHSSQQPCCIHSNFGNVTDDCSTVPYYISFVPSEDNHITRYIIDVLVNIGEMSSDNDNSRHIGNDYENECGMTHWFADIIKETCACDGLVEEDDEVGDEEYGLVDSVVIGEGANWNIDRKTVGRIVHFECGCDCCK